MAAASDLVVQVATGIGATGAIGAALTAMLSRRKTRAEVDATKADAAQVISQAAASLVGPLESRVQALTMQLNETDRMLREHAIWDREIVEALHGMGKDIRQPPPLWWAGPDDEPPPPPGTLTPPGH